MNLKTEYKSLVIMCLFVFTGVTANAKAYDSIKFKAELPYKFQGATRNVIKDSKNTLDPFFQKLYEVKKHGNEDLKTVSVVHMGDSHIQADFTTSTVRRLMQSNFGNAGRGLVAPLKLAKTGGGRNYRITSNDAWEFTRLIKPGSIPIGVAGVGLQVNNSCAKLNVETIDESYPGEWSFNKVTAFYDLGKANAYLSEPTLLQDRDTLGNYAESLLLKNHVSNLELEFSSPGDNQISFFGFNLTNGKSGVLYNAIGINGAHYFNYTTEELLCKQVSYLSPDLIIISLGTNEAYARSVNEERLYSEISDFVFNLRHWSPDAVIVLTTPAESLKRYARNKRAPNHLIKEVRDIIIKYAEKNGYAYWDLYGITGGKNSALQWNKKGLLVKDGVHFTRAGYDYIGDLLFEALAKAYNEYLRVNHGDI